MQRKIKTIYDDSFENQLAIIDELESKDYKVVILLDESIPYKSKIFVQNLNDDQLIEMVKDMRKLNIPSLK